jgi:hypothetical protein
MLSSVQTLKPLAAAALVALVMPAFAATTVYTTSASFLANVAAGAYLETFNTSQANAAVFNYSGSGFAYNATSTGLEMYGPAGFIGTSSPATALILTFTGGSPTAVGGNFYNTDFSDSFVSSPVTLTLSDGTTRTYTPAALGISYTGFISTVPIVSLTFSAPGASLYASLDNLTVGKAVVAAIPEASTYAMMLVGLGALGLLARRRRA